MLKVMPRRAAAASRVIQHAEQDLSGCERVATGAMAARDLDSVVHGDVVERAPAKAGDHLARHAHGTESAAGQPSSRHPLDFHREKAPVEVHIVADEHPSIDDAQQLIAHFGERRRVLHHVPRDIREAADPGRNGALRIDQGFEHRRRRAVANLDDGHFGNAIAAQPPACGFDVDDGVGETAQGVRRRKFDGPNQSPPAIGLAHDPPIASEQRYGHVLGHGGRHRRKLADVGDQRPRVGGARGEIVDRATGEQRLTRFDRHAT